MRLLTQPRTIAMLVAVLLLALLAWKGWRVYEAAQQARQEIYTLQTRATQLDTVADRQRLLEQLPVVDRSIQHLHREARPLLPVARLCGWLPVYGGDIAAAAPLLETARHLSAAVNSSTPLLAQAMRNPPADLSSDTLVQRVHLLALHTDALQHAAAEIEQARAAWATLDTTRLSPQLRQQARLDTIGALLPLLDAGIDGALLVGTLLPSDSPTTLTTAMLVQHLATATPQQYATAHEHLTAARAAWEAVPLADLPPVLTERLQPVPALLDLAPLALEAAPHLAYLLGYNAPRTYLLLLQNPDELRATGGFISAAGAITITQGTISGMTIRDSALLDDFTADDYPLAPPPLKQHMGLDLLALRDANWSPHFLIAARTARDLYSLTEGQQVDGVVALTPRTVQLLVAALGPLPVAGEPHPLTADTVLVYLQRAWNPAEAINAQWAARKTAYLEQLAQAVQERIAAGIGVADLLPTVQALRQALDERHLLVQVDDPAAAVWLAGQRWDGAVQATEQDMLMVIDSNVGYNKANANIRQHITYRADLSNPAAPTGRVLLQYRNLSPPASAAAPRCQIETVFLEGQYSDMTNRCYWNYARVLVPAGSRLLARTSVPTPATWTFSGVADAGTIGVQGGPAATLELSTLLVVPRAAERTIGLYYHLPPRVLVQDGDIWRYRLQVQKQAGREAVPLVVQVRLPGGATLRHTSLPPTAEAGPVLTFESMLATDFVLELTFTEGA
ncbi:MAG: DUF4012 domain-containing protein [Chloroflexaceae bacterium]|nr:DUF4012 domain-containing protein [Chloroflexaceae bacterium]